MTEGSYRTAPETAIGYEAWIEQPDGSHLCFIAHTWAELVEDEAVPRPIHGIDYERPNTHKPHTEGETEEEQHVDFYLAHFLSYSPH